MSARSRDRIRPTQVVTHVAVFLLVSALAGVLVAGLAIPFAAVAGLGAKQVSSGINELPKELQTAPLAQRTRVLASDGSLLATLYNENRINIDLPSVAPIMRKAILAIEDYRFYEHGALDLKGTMRAFVTNTANDGAVQGGSSITQQMVKQTLINQAESPEEAAAAQDRTYARKIAELQYAIAVEQNYSKDWILERYLNISYFGDGAYGIEAAARHYYSKPAKALKLQEAALLAGVVKNPSLYDPTNNPEASRERRNVVLARMAELNVVKQKRANKASRMNLGLKVSKEPNGCVGTNGEFFCELVRAYLLNDKTLGKTVAARREFINTGGLTIETTIDPVMQTAADAAVANAVYPTDQAIGGIAEVVPGTGEVRALAQSRPQGPDRAKGQSYLSFVTPSRFGGAAGFQGGSTFKAFVLAAAVNQGVPLSAEIKSPQELDFNDAEFRDCNGPVGDKDFTIENSTGEGTYDLYSGTQKSVNTFYLQLESRTGLCEPIRLARQMGIKVPETAVVPTFTLGVSDTDVLSMANAYATFGARGRFCEIKPVSRILGPSGDVVAEYPDKCRQVMPESTADAVNDVLRGVQESGGFGYSRGLNLDRPSAAKTGTTSSNKAVWFMGYTPELSVASMIAGANTLGQPISLNGQVIGGTYIAEAFGSTQAGPMWGDAIKPITGRLASTDFTEPDLTAVQGQQVSVPTVDGQSTAGAAETLRSAGFIPTVGPTVDSGYSAGSTAYTSPRGGSTAGTGSTVVIYVSDGTPYVAPPPPSTSNGGGQPPQRRNGNNGRGR